MNKVKADLNKHFAEKQVLREARLAKKAKEKGISTEELKAQIANKRLERLESKAKERGITTTELKAKMMARHRQMRETMAKDVGLSVEQLNQIMPAHPIGK